MIRTNALKLAPAAGGAGAAVSSGNVIGELEPARLLAVKYDFGAGGQAATTTVSIKDETGAVVAKAAAGNTTRREQPSTTLKDNAGAATTTLAPPFVSGKVTADVAAANAGDVVTVVLYYDPL